MAIIAEAGGLHRTRAGHDDHSTMSRVQDKDAELGRREGLYGRRARSGRWLPFKARRSRLLLTLAVLGVMWLLFQILPMPSSAMIPEGARKRWSNPADGVERFPGENAPPKDLFPDIPPPPSNPTGVPPRNDKDPNNPFAKHYYNEVIKFYNLSPSLRKIHRTGGFKEFNRNVLFAASTTKSLSALIPLACDMRKWDRNTVHFAIFGRDDFSLEELQQINGVDAETCDIYWHDARPDYAAYSTDLRAETGAAFAFKNINEFMHPQVIITADLDEEDQFFKRAVHTTAQEQRHPIIQIPQEAAETLSWIAHLDVEPLRLWHDVSVEILVHAPPNSVGSLRRLMQSLMDADYTGVPYPRLTFEIPVDIDPMLKHFLEQVSWPPQKNPKMEHLNSLTVRHRIPSRKVSPEEASIRFVESFYPTNPSGDHVLVLSPNAQLSPLYYQYLMYNLLQYKYSDRLSEGTEHLLGISLDLPGITLDGVTPLKAPDASFYDRPYDLNGHHNGSTPFLWEAPNSGAALYFGDKWKEIHSFITNRLVPRPNSVPRDKAVSAVFPSWLEYFFEYTRLRGYALLYPSLQDESTLVTVHHESTYRPEEFDHMSATRPDPPATPSETKTAKAKRDLVEQPGTTPELDDRDPFVIPLQMPPPIPEQVEPLLSTSDIAVTRLLPNDGDLLSLERLPFLTHKGVSASRGSAYNTADAFAQTFRKEQGGCADDPMFKTGRTRWYVPGSANDLFCTGEETDDDYMSEAYHPPSSDDSPILGTGDASGASEFPIKDSILTDLTPEKIVTLAGEAGSVPAQAPLGGDALPAAGAPAAGGLPPPAGAVPDFGNAPPAGGVADTGVNLPVGGLPPAADAPPPVNFPPANLPPAGDVPPAINIAPAGDLPVAGAPAIPDPPPTGDLPAAGAPVQQNFEALIPGPGDGSLGDPAVVAQLQSEVVPPAEPEIQFNLPKRPLVPMADHESNRPLRVREKDGNVVALPSDAQN